MSDPSFRCGFIAIVGRPNVGKSTLMNHLVGQKISITSKKAQTTRQRVTGIRTDEAAQFLFVDTPGYQRDHKSALNEVLNHTVKETLTAVDCVLFVVEAMRWTNADKELLPLLPHNTPVVLVVNKLDKSPDKMTLSRFIAALTQDFAFADVEVVSAKHSQRLAELLAKVRPYLPESVPLYPMDSITDKSERFCAAEIIREKLFRYLGEELPYMMTVNVEQFEFDKGLYRINAVILVDKHRQKGIVVGKKGEKLKTICTEARLDMEKLFTSKVFLRVWVKVKSGWADEPLFLKGFGLD